ncbi:MAG: caspase family protein [Limnohabitans sp.]
MKRAIRIAILLWLSGTAVAQVQTATVSRAGELRADKLAAANVLASVAAGAVVKVNAIEGGWVLVETSTPAGRVAGWMRAGTLNMQPQSASIAGLSSGREAAGNNALTLGVRSIPKLAARSNRHALIIGVGRYADASVSSLPGTRVDRESATQMAQWMQVPAENIRYLQDDQATGKNIRAEIAALSQRVQEGDRVFVYYSGHGTRYSDPQTGGCVEALLPYDGMSQGILSNKEMSALLSGIGARSDKMFVMYDACFSGGLLQVPEAARTRGINLNDEGALRPKFSLQSDQCARPSNVTTRGVVQQQSMAGALPQDTIHLSAARDNEISFDDEAKGGLATQYVRDCMLREAQDVDGSGAITMDEIRQCAQEKINRRMQGQSNYKAHHLVLSGNQNFVPTWFSLPPPAAVAPLVPPPSAPTAAVQPAVTVAVTTPPPPPAVDAAPSPAAPAQMPTAAVQANAGASAGPANLTGEQALRQLYEQRNAKRRVNVNLRKPELVIGQDHLAFDITSDRAGYVYAALAGSDGKALYMLFPNDLDQNNRIEAGQTLSLPAANWRIRASGPQGTNHLLVMVADAPRDLTSLSATKAGPFLMSLNDAQGRTQLGAMFTTSRLVSSQACQNTRQSTGNPLCSDAYGAAMAAVKEISK